MKKLSVIIGEKLPMKSEIRNFELKHCVTLPKLFIDFLQSQNPVYTQECYFYVKGKEPFDIFFFPFSERSEHWTIQKGTENLFESFYDRRYIPFGADSGGWQYVISVDAKDYGKIYFCRMDEELDRALTFLAEDICEFINGLASDEELTQ